MILSIAAAAAVVLWALWLRSLFEAQCLERERDLAEAESRRAVQERFRRAGPRRGEEAQRGHDARGAGPQRRVGRAEEDRRRGGGSVNFLRPAARLGGRGGALTKA